jgi:hypothetical protein
VSSAAATIKFDRETVPAAAKTEVVEDLCGYGNETFAHTCRFVGVIVIYFEFQIIQYNRLQAKGYRTCQIRIKQL